MTRSRDDETFDGVAVIGLAGRFPGAASVDELWENLKAGRESIRTFTDEELVEAGIPNDLVADPSYVKARGLLDHPELFDAAFFGISPREAEMMDPQHRLFLETCWHALEAAGYAPASIPGPVGVWGGMSTGMSNDTYLHSNLGGPGGVPEQDGLQAMLGNENDYLTTRVSYKLNLRGPSVNVQTACSTSLVAISQAFQSLLTYGCDMALAGGVSVSYPQRAGYLHQEGGIGSPDGHCRPFDADAQGTVFSNGVGVVVLKRMEDAVADGDTILAVIRGAAMNNDGAAKVSFAAPSVEGQAEVIATAQAVAGVDPGSITFVETHGTGTPIGDPIEVEGLRRAFRRGTPETGFCALGSIKSNFGHLDSAAGVAGFIKTVLCLHHRTLVPTVHFTRPSPKVDWDSSPFYVNARTCAWDTDRLPRRAGVSAFGIGGTNAHVVLEEAPRSRPTAEPAGLGVELLPLSARSPEALREGMEKLAAHLERRPHPRLQDVAHTLQVGREAFRHRAAVVASQGSEAAGILVQGDRQGDRSRLLSGEAGESGDGVVFLFPGGGAQYVGMGRDLYRAVPAFRRGVDRGLELLLAREGLDLRPVWFPEPGAEVEAEAAFQRPSVQLPAIFILEMAMARLLMDWGFKPSALIGHSMGENTAACLSGVFSYEDALGLVALRGRLFDSAAPGGMLSVTSSAGELAPHLGPELDLAAVNGPEQCTVSGPKEALARLQRDLEAAGIDAQAVPIEIAAHSALVDPLMEPFEAYLRSLELHPPTIPFLSNRTGAWITDAEARDPAYWAAHLRSTVRFADNVGAVLAQGRRFFLEVGPGRILSSLVKLSDPGLAPRVASTMRHPKDEVDDRSVLMQAVARIWVGGGEVDWTRIRGDAEVRRVPLPGYAFQRRPFLVEPGRVAPGTHAATRWVVGSDAHAPQAPSPATDVPVEAGAERDPEVILRSILDLQSRTHAAIQAYIQAVGSAEALRSLPPSAPAPITDVAAVTPQAGASPQVEESPQVKGAPAVEESQAGTASPEVEESPRPEMGERLAFWEARLGSPVPVLDLMTDHPRTADVRVGRSTVSTTLSAPVLVEVEHLAREEDVPPTVILLAALHALLYHQTGQRDLVVGTPAGGVVEGTSSEGASEGALEDAILPLRLEVDPGASFRDLVRSAGRVAREGWRHRGVEEGVLLDRLGVPKDPTRRSLYQVRLTHGSIGDHRARGESAASGGKVADETEFDLWVDASSREAQVSVEYASGLFASATMEDLAAHFVELLGVAVASPATPIRSLPRAAPGVMDRVARWNDTPLALPPARDLANWLTEGWSARADEVALVTGGERLTFGELDRRSNRLAHHLAEAGVRPGSLVGVCLERTADLVVAVVAAWKAGAGYVPMDPTYPTERLELMADRAELGLVVTAEALIDRIGRYGGRRILLDRDREVIAARAPTRPGVEADLSHPAYVIFTSGSTGEPKGVRVSGRSVMNLLESMARRPGFHDADVLLAVTTLSFDISVLELFLPLRVGGTLVLASPADAMDGSALSRMMEEHGVTCLQATPVTWRLLLASGWWGRSGLKALCGGEAFPRDLLPELLPRVGEVWNMYGPTETTGWSTCARLTDGEGPIVIGSPIHNTRCHVLDPEGARVAPGVPGELYIGGLGVADGYVGRPEETTRRFVQDPFTHEGARLYRTGDVVRWRRDGSLEYLHRMDQQVKVRGFRVELGEIESTLAALPGIRGAAVVVREMDGAPELAGYVAADPGAWSERTLRDRVAESLPAYMVPRVLLRMDELPLTDNGKVDRKALPDPGNDSGWGAAPELAAPESEAETYLFGVWQNVLEVPSLSVHDNFFDLGGHSLLAVRTIARIREERGVVVPLRALLTGTLGMIAATYLEGGGGDAGEGNEVPTVEARADGVLGTVRGWLTR